MKLFQHKVTDDELHDWLIKTPMFWNVYPRRKNKLYAQVFLPEWMSDNSDDVAVYEYPVRSLIDDWINDNVCGPNQKLDRSGKKDAEKLILELECMIASLRAVMD